MSGALSGHAVCAADVSVRTRRRLANAIELPNGCRVMTSSLSHRYPVVEIKGKATRASRAVYAVCWGAVPEGRVILHRCDTPNCVNPHHLVLGTQRDNMRDAAAKGRVMGPHSLNRVATLARDLQRTRTWRATAPARAIQMVEQVAQGISIAAVGRLHGVTRQTVTHVLKGVHRNRRVETALASLMTPRTTATEAFGEGFRMLRKPRAKAGAAS